MKTKIIPISEKNKVYLVISPFQNLIWHTFSTMNIGIPQKDIDLYKPNGAASALYKGQRSHKNFLFKQFPTDKKLLGNYLLKFTDTTLRLELENENLSYDKFIKELRLRNLPDNHISQSLIDKINTSWKYYYKKEWPEINTKMETEVTNELVDHLSYLCTEPEKSTKQLLNFISSHKNKISEKNEDKYKNAEKNLTNLLTRPKHDDEDKWRVYITLIDCLDSHDDVFNYGNYIEIMVVGAKKLKRMANLIKKAKEHASS